MRRFKVVVTVEGQDEPVLLDGLEHDGKCWLVPNWLDSSDGQWMMPERIVLLDGMPAEADGDDLILADALPASLLFGSVSAALKDRYTVEHWPPIRLPAEEEES
jgi:hypothetical protein